MKYLSIVIPAYNEARRIIPTLNEIVHYLSKLGEDSEIIIVNDGSTDKTEEIIRRFMDSLDELRRHKIQVIYIKNKQNKGKGAALKAGVGEAQGSYILFTDADNSTSIDEIKKLLPYVESQYDIAIGSRSMKGSVITQRQSLIRQTMGKIFNRIVRVTTLRGFIDTQCGFKLFKRKAAKTVFNESLIDGFAIDVEILYVAKQKGFKIIEVPVAWTNHPNTHVRLFSSSLRMLLDILKIRGIHIKH